MWDQRQPQPGVDQISISPTFNSATGNAMCIHATSGAVSCIGDDNSNGAFGDGMTTPSATFVPWSMAADIAHLAAIGDPRCVLTHAGEFQCAGFGYGATPTRVDTGGGHTTLWLDGSGKVQIDDPTVFREFNGSPCDIEADGLHCLAPMVEALSGTAGDVVDGVVVAPPGGLAMGDPLACWLDTHGVVRCGVSGISEQRFASAPPILAIAGSFYTESFCAVADDGSLWCIGPNTNGELGTGSKTPVATETMVQPPGSVGIDCQ